MQIVLASGSPRRKELLEMLGVEDMLIIPAKGEECPPENAGPEELVKALSFQKAAEIAAVRDSGDLIIGADTIVWVNGKVFGKPHSEEEALSENDKISEFMFMGLRMKKGISRNEFFRRFDRRIDDVFGDVIKSLKSTGFMQEQDGMLFLTDKGEDVSNEIFIKFMH